MWQRKCIKFSKACTLEVSGSIHSGIKLLLSLFSMASEHSFRLEEHWSGYNFIIQKQKYIVFFFLSLFFSNVNKFQNTVDCVVTRSFIRMLNSSHYPKSPCFTLPGSIFETGLIKLERRVFWVSPIQEEESEVTNILLWGTSLLLVDNFNLDIFDHEEFCRTAIFEKKDPK